MKKYICSNCGSLSDFYYKKNDGCFVVFLKILFHIILLIMLFTPVWFISIIVWALWLVIVCASHKAENCCPNCKAENTIMTTDSPKGKELLNHYHINNETES